MKKSTKGALAAAAAGTLMVGGTGSLAFWTGSTTISGANINSGSITMSATPDCTDDAGDSTDNGAHDWTYANDASFAGAVVPGDVITKVCYMDLDVTGGRASTKLGVTGGVLTKTSGTGTTLHTDMTPVASFIETSNGDAPVVSGVTVAGQGPHRYKATVTVTFPYGASAVNTSQDEVVSLSGITLTATQQSPS